MHPPNLQTPSPPPIPCPASFPHGGRSTPRDSVRPQIQSYIHSAREPPGRSYKVHQRPRTSISCCLHSIPTCQKKNGGCHNQPPDFLQGTPRSKPLTQCSSSLLTLLDIQLIRDCNNNVQRMRRTEELIYLSQKIEFECKVSRSLAPPPHL